jgi:predicted aminopeptidase
VRERCALLLLFVLCGGMGCSGCSPVYVLRGAVAQGRILLSREPIPRVLAGDRITSQQRARLELVEEVRRFAEEELGMDVGAAYGTYAEVPPGALVWVVSAARQTRLESYTWWFPIVGSVSYKGFFEESEAEILAGELGSEGWDVYLRTSNAFSTLGWFDDPVLSSWLVRGEVALADLVLHELLHRSFYLPGHTDFNESFASWVGHAGAREFFARRDGAEAETTRLAERRYDQAMSASTRFDGAVATLRALYDQAERRKWPRARTLEAREEIFATLGMAGEVNNAVILARWAYRKALPDFACAAATYGGNLRAKLAAIEARAADAEDPFAAIACAGDGGHSGQSEGVSAGLS